MRIKQGKGLILLGATGVLVIAAAWLLRPRPEAPASPEDVAILGVRPPDRVAAEAAHYLISRISTFQGDEEVAKYLGLSKLLKSVTCLYPEEGDVYDAEGPIGKLPGRWVRFRVDLSGGEAKYIEVDMRQYWDGHWEPNGLRISGDEG